LIALQKLQRSIVDDYDAIVLAKKQDQTTVALLNRARPRVVASYGQLEGSGPIGMVPNGHFGLEAKALESMYSNRTLPLKEIRRALFERIGTDVEDLCPYCLASSSPRTLDHHLPKKRFPELSACHINLIPACSECQDHKDQSVNDVVNLYFFQPTFGCQWLHGVASVGSLTGSIGVAFKCEPPSTDPAGAAIVQHFDTLDLCARYSRKIAELVSEAIALWQGTPPVSIGASFLNAAAYVERTLGPNYWKAVAYRAVAASPSCLAEVQNRLPPGAGP